MVYIFYSVWCGLQSTKVRYSDIIGYHQTMQAMNYGLGYRCTGNGCMKRMALCSNGCKESLIELILRQSNDINECGCCSPRCIVISTDDPKGLLALLQSKCGQSQSQVHI